MTAQRLRQETSAVHVRVEATLNLLDPGLTPGRLRRVLERLYGFWGGTEPAIDTWVRSHPHRAQLLDWPRRRRIDHLRADLTALGARADTLSLAPPVRCVAATCDADRAASSSDAAVFGWLYVAEGSTLGGAVLDRRLRPLTDSLGVTLRSFTPYAEGPGPMWQAYHYALDSWVGADDGRADAVVAAAVATFETLEHWVTPLRDGVAA